MSEGRGVRDPSVLPVPRQQEAGMCEICEQRKADRTVTIEKPSRQTIMLHTCPFCALVLVGYERD